MSRFSVSHRYSRAFYLNYILLPLGYKLNAKLKEAKKGDRLNLEDATVLIDHVRIMHMRDSMTDVLCRMKYGRAISTVFMVWQRNAVALGMGKEAVDDVECLCVFFSNDML